MQLGAFSVSLAVKDLKVSRAFYEKLGFQMIGGDMEHNYAIMKNGDAIVGLFQGMFEQNILTFNPGWDQEAGELQAFEDVRVLHEKINAKGIKTEQVSLEGEKGPGSFVVVDPDGNPILIDQHI